MDENEQKCEEIWTFLNALHAGGYGVPTVDMKNIVPYIVRKYDCTYDFAIQEVKKWVDVRDGEKEEIEPFLLVEG